MRVMGKEVKARCRLSWAPSRASIGTYRPVKTVGKEVQGDQCDSANVVSACMTLQT